MARKMSLRLVSDMPDSNRNWKNHYFFVQVTDWVCRPEEWDSMPNGFDNTWGIVKESGGSSVSIFALALCLDEAPNIFLYCLQLKSICRLAMSKRASFGEFGPYPISKGSGRIWLPLTHFMHSMVALNQCFWLDGCTLFPVDVSYSFSTIFGPSALFSHAFHCPFAKMDASKQRAIERKFVATRKQLIGSLLSASKVGAKAVLRRKSDTKDKQWKSSSPPPPPRHRVGKGLMMRKGLVAPDPV